MNIIIRSRELKPSRYTGRVAAIAAFVGVMTAVAGCGIEKQSAPALMGPSEFGQSITLTASPDQLARDGESQSVITVTALDASSRPIAGLGITLFANAGFLSSQQVVTGPDGRTTAVYTAPSMQEVVDTAVIRALPVGTNIDNANARNVAIALLAPAAANAAFTVSPSTPQRFAETVLDASTTTLNGGPCNSACTYEWTLGSEATLTGQTVTYRFQREGVYTVVLSVTSPGGITTRRQQVVTVGEPTLPTPDFTFSPTDPQPFDQVNFNATASRAANGATIVEYLWDFGNGASGSGVTTSIPRYNREGTFQVTLTVVDSNGLRASVSKSVAVAFRDSD
jgi:PKD repeat protein